MVTAPFLLFVCCGFGSQTLRPFPLRLTQAVVVRQQRLRQHSLPGCGHLLCHKCYGSGTAAPQRRGCLQHTRHIAVFIIAQTRAITNKKQGLFAIFYKISQICHRPGVIVQQAGVGGKVESRTVYLCAAGFYDYLDQGAVVAAEWSENFADLLALENPIRVNIERLDDTTRRITIEGVTV